MKPIHYTLPVYWASYLINEDDSGLEESEIVEIKAWLTSQSLSLCSCIGCEDDEGFSRSNDANNLGSTVCTFVFHED